MIKYLGSKRQLIPEIMAAVQSGAPNARSILDLFSGTARVGHALKNAGYQVFSNDHNQYAHILAKAYVEADLTPEIQKSLESLIKEFNQMAGQAGYFTQKFCLDARFFHPKNGERVDAIRDAITKKSLSPELEAVVLVSLMEAADRVDSTCGLQMAFLKNWAPRAHNDLSLRLPALLPQAKHGKGRAYCLEGSEAAGIEADVAYLDPPYNQHSYRANYHVWETLILWDKPEVYGRVSKRADCRVKKSPFNSKTQFMPSFSDLIQRVKAKTLIVSFNNEGFVTREDMETLLSSRGKVDVVTKDYKRYVGAQIGIYNQQGKKVGKVSHLKNQEYLYIVSGCR